MEKCVSKDYYSILGVDHNAAQDDIKKAYRQKAKQYHPDVNVGTDAEAKFKEISEAYSVLGDSEKRRMYDMGGLNNAHGFGGSPIDIFDGIFNDFFGGGFRSAHVNNTRRNIPPVIKTAVNVTLQEVYTGTKKEVRYFRSKICKGCNGNGAKSNSGWEMCSDCGGSGARQRSMNQGPMNVIINSPCHKCNGQGRILKEPCDDCKGRGFVDAAEVIKVDIPKGVGDRQVIKINGMGHQADHHIFSDVWCIVQILDHEVFKRDGNNLMMNKEITLKQALVGGEIPIQFLDGSNENIKLNSPIQPNTSMVLKGKGLPDLTVHHMGDLIITFYIKIPSLSSAQKSEIERILN